jgi:hypothetical protein
VDAETGSRNLVDGGVAATAEAGTPYPQTAHHVPTAHEARLIESTLVFLDFDVLKVLLILLPDYLMPLSHPIY